MQKEKNNCRCIDRMESCIVLYYIPIPIQLSYKNIRTKIYTQYYTQMKHLQFSTQNVVNQREPKNKTRSFSIFDISHSRITSKQVPKVGIKLQFFLSQLFRKNRLHIPELLDD